MRSTTQRYLRDLLARIPSHPHSRIYELFPDNWLRLRQEAAETEATSVAISHASVS